MGQFNSAGNSAAIAAHLVLEPIMGRCMNVMDGEGMAKLVTGCKGARLIVIDTISRVHRLDENSNGDMGTLMQALEYLAKETGAAVLFAHHVSKSSVASSQNDQQYAARGASILTDNARWAASLTKMSTEEAGKLGELGDAGCVGEARRGFYVRFSVPKQNYGNVMPDRWFKRDAGGVLLPVELSAEKSEREPRPARGGRSANGKATIFDGEFGGMAANDF